MRQWQVIGARQLTAIAVLFSLITVSAEAQFGRGGPDPRAREAETPRLANGKPDLTGSWRSVGGGPEGVAGGMFRRCSPFQDNCMEWTNQSADFTFMASSRAGLSRRL